MIIYKLHIVCITILPSENYAPLRIHPYCVECLQITSLLLQFVGWRDSQIINFLGSINVAQTTQCFLLQRVIKSLYYYAVKNLFSSFICKRSNHKCSVPHYILIVNFIKSGNCGSRPSARSNCSVVQANISGCQADRGISGAVHGSLGLEGGRKELFWTNMIFAMRKRWLLCGVRGAFATSLRSMRSRGRFKGLFMFYALREAMIHIVCGFATSRVIGGRTRNRTKDTGIFNA